MSAISGNMACVKRDHSQGAPEYEYYTKNCDDVGRNFENIRRISLIIKKNQKQLEYAMGFILHSYA